MLHQCPLRKLQYHNYHKQLHLTQVVRTRLPRDIDSQDPVAVSEIFKQKLLEIQYEIGKQSCDNIQSNLSIKATIGSWPLGLYREVAFRKRRLLGMSLYLSPTVFAFLRRDGNTAIAEVTGPKQRGWIWLGNSLHVSLLWT